MSNNESVIVRMVVMLDSFLYGWIIWCFFNNCWCWCWIKYKMYSTADLIDIVSNTHLLNLQMDYLCSVFDTCQIIMVTNFIVSLWNLKLRIDCLFSILIKRFLCDRITFYWNVQNMYLSWQKHYLIILYVHMFVVKKSSVFTLN